LLLKMRITKDNTVEIEIPEGVEFSLDGHTIIAKGPKGETKRNIYDPDISVELAQGKVVLKPKRLKKPQKKRMGTIAAHIKNMIKGVTQGILYKLKICSGHFPMSVQVRGQEFVVSNFIGEKFPRVLKLKYDDVKVEVNGDIVEVSGVDKERVAQTAADIEMLLKRTEYDKRIYQDGIYIIEKDGKPVK